MKRFIILITAGLLLAVQCSDDSPTSPEPVEKPIAEAVIGSDGGAVGTDDIIITIPENAFSTNQTIMIYKADDSDFGFSACSQIYRLEGLPATFSQPITFMLKIIDSLSYSNYLAFGDTATYYSDSSAQVYFNLYDAHDSSGYLIGDIPARTGVAVYKTGFDTDLLNFFFTISSYKETTSDDGYFKVYYPIDYEEYVSYLIPYLLKARELTESYGFDRQGFKGSYYSLDLVNVYLVKLDQGYYISNSASGRGKAEIRINTDMLTSPNLANIRLKTGTAYFKIIEWRYFRSSYFVVDTWLYFNLATWFSGRFDYSDNIPDDFIGHEIEAFRGSGYYSDADRANWNLSMSSFLEYIIDRYGINTLHSVLKGYYQSGTYAFEALIDTLPDPEYDWWHDFAYNYLLGNIYNVTVDKFIAQSALSGTFTIDSPTDTLKMFSNYYRDFSARIYKIDPNSASLNSNSILQVKLNTTINDDYVECYLLRHYNGLMNLVAYGDSLIDINAAEYRDLGAEYIVMVINSYNESPFADSILIDLEVKLIQSFEMNFKSFGMVFSVMGSFESTTGSFWDAEFNYSDCCKGFGEMSGYTFSSTWDTTFTGKTSQGNLTAILSTDLTRIISFVAYDSTYSTAYDETYVTEISGHDIPFSYEYDGDLYFEIIDDETCNSLNMIDYRVYWDPNYTSLTDYDCAASSRVWFVFRND